MQTHFVFRQMETSDALRSYAEERLEKIKRYFADPLKISCAFSVEKFNDGLRRLRLTHDLYSTGIYGPCVSGSKNTVR